MKLVTRSLFGIESELHQWVVDFLGLNLCRRQSDYEHCYLRYWREGPDDEAQFMCVDNNGTVFPGSRHLTQYERQAIREHRDWLEARKALREID